MVNGGTGRKQKSFSSDYIALIKLHNFIEVAASAKRALRGASMLVEKSNYGTFFEQVIQLQASSGRHCY